MQEIYTTAWSEDLVALQDQVNALLREGWSLAGGISFNPNAAIYVQAVFLSVEVQEEKAEEKARREWHESHKQIA